MGRLTSRTRLKPGKGPETRTPMKKRNNKRAKRRRERDFGAKAEYIRSMPCCACGKDGPSDPHHHPSRGAGGTSADLVPLCFLCHREFHDAGADTFQARHEVDLTEKAATYEAMYVAGDMVF